MRAIRVFITAVLCGGAFAKAGQTYTATDLGELSGSPDTYTVRPTGINNAGQVVGYGGVLAGQVNHPFVWTPQTPNGTTGSMIDLGDMTADNPDWSSGSATAINASGQVVGYCGGANGDGAFLWNPSTPNGTSGTLITLPNPPGQFTRGRAAWGINASGQIAGISIPPSGDLPRGGQTAFVWNPAVPNGGSGTLTDIVDSASSTGSGFTASGINASGQFVSNCNSGPSLWTPGTGGVYSQTILSTLSEVDALNDRGQVVGYAQSGTHTVACVWTPSMPNGTTGTLQIIPAGQFNSVARAINGSGQVVGDYSTLISESGWAPYVWDPNSGFTDLTTAIDNSMGSFSLISAVGINDSGQIAAVGAEYIPLIRGDVITGYREVDHAFLLNPDAVPEPTAGAALAMLILAIANRRRV